MIRRTTSTARLLIFIILGLFFGGILGEGLGLVLGQFGEMFKAGWDNPVRNLFVAGLEFDLGMKDGGIVIDLYMIKFQFGIGFKLNLASILGMVISLNIMKWSGDR
jgi:hypothetical protein